MSEEPKIRVSRCDDEASWMVEAWTTSRKGVIEIYDDGSICALISDGKENKVVGLGEGE